MSWCSGGESRRRATALFTDGELSLIQDGSRFLTQFLAKILVESVVRIWKIFVFIK